MFFSMGKPSQLKLFIPWKKNLKTNKQIPTEASCLLLVNYSPISKRVGYLPLIVSNFPVLLLLYVQVIKTAMICVMPALMKEVI